jgi:hypothetical protein
MSEMIQVYYAGTLLGSQTDNQARGTPATAAVPLPANHNGAPQTNSEIGRDLQFTENENTVEISFPRAGAEYAAEKWVCELVKHCRETLREVLRSVASAESDESNGQGVRFSDEKATVTTRLLGFITLPRVSRSNRSVKLSEVWARLNVRTRYRFWLHGESDGQNGSDVTRAWLLQPM